MASTKILFLLPPGHNSGLLEWNARRRWSRLSYSSPWGRMQEPRSDTGLKITSSFTRSQWPSLSKATLIHGDNHLHNRIQPPILVIPQLRFDDAMVSAAWFHSLSKCALSAPKISMGPRSNLAENTINFYFTHDICCVSRSWSVIASFILYSSVSYSFSSYNRPPGFMW